MRTHTCGDTRTHTHAAVCRCGGHKILRHSRIVACLRGILRESGAVVAPREVVVPAWRGADGTEARLEVSYTALGVRRFADVTVRHPRANRYWRVAADEDGHAAIVGERSKTERYPAVPDAALLPVEAFGVETFGRLGPQALDVLRSARGRVVERLAPSQRWVGAALHARWLGQLSVALLCGLFDAALGSWGALVVPPLAEGAGGPLPSALAAWPGSA